MKAATAPNSVHIGKVVRYARIFNFRDLQGEAVSDSSLLDAVDRLFARLAEVDYLLVGGIALLQYVAGRNTDNIDLIMDLTSMERIPPGTTATSGSGSESSPRTRGS